MPSNAHAAPRLQLQARQIYQIRRCHTAQILLSWFMKQFFMQQFNLGANLQTNQILAGLLKME